MELHSSTAATSRLCIVLLDISSASWWAPPRWSVWRYPIPAGKLAFQNLSGWGWLTYRASIGRVTLAHRTLSQVKQLSGAIFCWRMRWAFGRGDSQVLQTGYRRLELWFLLLFAMAVCYEPIELGISLLLEVKQMLGLYYLRPFGWLLQRLNIHADHNSIWKLILSNSKSFFTF